MDRIEFRTIEENIVSTAKNSLLVLLKKLFYENKENNVLDLKNVRNISCYLFDEYYIYPKNLFINTCDEITLYYDCERQDNNDIYVNNVKNIDEMSIEELFLLCKVIKDQKIFN